jgi:1,2-phenylacetyl-CoA epoxidase catalytic subunit
MMKSVNDMKSSTKFYDGLIASIEQSQANAPTEASTFFAGEFSQGQLIEFLKFQAYYERRAAEFIAGWLPHTPEIDIFGMLAQQIRDEAVHYQLHMKSLSKLGVDTIEDYALEPEWIAWIDEWYPTGEDTIERVAAHNVTGELGAYKAFEEVYDLVPKFVQETIDRIIPDEKFHMKLGKQCIKKYCVTEDQQRRVRDRVNRTLVLQQNARNAFNRRMAEAA